MPVILTSAGLGAATGSAVVVAITSTAVAAGGLLLVRVSLPPVVPVALSLAGPPERRGSRAHPPRDVLRQRH